jgi:quinol monooxygenase YgiN
LDRRDEHDEGGEMPVAVVQDWADGGRDTTSYDAIHERVMASGAPEGCRMHSAGATPDGGFRIFEVWESQDHFDRFVQERLMPIMKEIGVGGDPPSVTSYELREYMAT